MPPQRRRHAAMNVASWPDWQTLAAPPTAIALALAVDRWFGEPPVRWHPVVWMGRCLNLFGPPLIRLQPETAFVGGAAAWLVGAAAVGLIAVGADRVLSELPLPLKVLGVGLLLKPMLSWQMLRDEVAAVESALTTSVEAGRAQLQRLVSRDVWQLDAEQVRESALESLAENLNDSQWFSPNKALDTTGVHARYLLAPRDLTQGRVDAMLRLSPSWVLSAEGVALLGAWADPAMQTWLRASIDTLICWEHCQRKTLDALGWRQQASVTPFWLVRPPQQGDVLAQRLIRLRERGIKLRDATSLGCPGWLRVSVQSPEAQQALVDAWRRAGQGTA